MTIAIAICVAIAFFAWFTWELFTAPDDPNDSKAVSRKSEI